MNRAYVRPLRDRLVRDLITREPIPEGGADVEMTGYIRRRIDEGDLEITDPPKERHPAPVRHEVQEADD